MTNRGYTLVEVLLVLALLALVAMLAAPVVFQGGARSTLHDAGEKVGKLWGNARLDAATQGQTYVFRCGANGASCETAPLGAATADPLESQAAAERSASLELAQGVVIHSLLVGEPAGAEMVGGALSTGGITPVIVFRPDGATSDAEAILQHESGRQLRVTLRGMTGATRVEDVEAEEQ